MGCDKFEKLYELLKQMRKEQENEFDSAKLNDDVYEMEFSLGVIKTINKIQEWLLENK